MNARVNNEVLEIFPMKFGILEGNEKWDKLLEICMVKTILGEIRVLKREISKLANICGKDAVRTSCVTFQCKRSFEE